MSLAVKENGETNDKSSPWWKALPFDLRDVQVSTGIRPIGFRYSQSIMNIEAKLGDQLILACGEGSTPDLAMTKAIGELVERASMMEWCRKYTLSGNKTSNGWAAHDNLEDAKANAAFERTERDAVLAQWYTSTPFLEIEPASLPKEIDTWISTELALSEFPKMRVLISTMGLGPSVTCLVVNHAGFGVSGHATKSTLQESLESAIAETCRAAHHTLRRSYWSDSAILKGTTRSGRVEPGTHSVYYAYHEPFPAWMFGRLVSWNETENIWRQRIDMLKAREFSRFSFTTTLHDPMVVGFATHPECLDLNWGPTEVNNILNTAASKRFADSLTEQTLNRQPHIVS